MKYIPHKIFCAGIYCSEDVKSKSMPAPDIYLEQFVNDLKQFSSVEIDKKSIPVKLHAFVCDAPVRAALKGTVLHSGYHSCERCTVRGEYHHNTVVFLETNCEKRSNQSFHERKDPDHHTKLDHTILENTGFPMVDGFAIDSMHLCFIGVMKRILARLISPKVKKNRVKLNSESKSELSTKLILYEQYIPCEFGRKFVGGVNFILKWKASQYRTLLLYVGVVLFRNRKIAPIGIFKNFLKFSIALRLLNMEDQSCNLKFIEKLLIEFIQESKLLYGNSFVSYNVHNLYHLCDDYNNYGPLDKISAFSFESYLGSNIKSAVRSGFKPLIQIAKHVEDLNSNTEFTQFGSSHSSVKYSKFCSHANERGKCIKSLKIDRMTLKPASNADSFIMMPNKQIGTSECCLT